MNVARNNNTNRIIWLDYLRAFSCLVVVAIHTISGWTSTIDASNLRARIGMDIIESFRVAVPLFLMISGALLLRKNTVITFEKCKVYIVRMLLVLATFGLAYCLIESFMNGQRGFSLIINSIANLLSGESWGVMWYVYMIIGIYMLMPILKKYTDNCDNREFATSMILFFIIGSMIPTINGFLGLKITNFYLGISIYVFYFLLGQCMYRCRISSRYLWVLLIIGCIGTTIKNELAIKMDGDLASSFMVMISLAIFVLFKNIDFKENRWVSFIAKYSFGIYLIHCLWINILYKGLHIYPDIMPPVIGEFAIYLCVFLASCVGSVILCRIPLFRKIIN